jgi:uncharacterized protein
MVTAFYTGLLGLIYIVLSVRVIRCRHKYKIALGDGDNFKLLRKIRAHQNFMEYTPLFLILLAFADLFGLIKEITNAFGVLFVLGRISHAYGISKGEIYKYKVLRGNILFRTFGMIITLTSIGLLSLFLIALTATEIFGN